MTANQILAALRDSGYTQESLAQTVPTKPDRSYVSHVIRQRVRSEVIEKAVSKATGIPLHKLWPEWYPEDRGEAA